MKGILNEIKDGIDRQFEYEKTFNIAHYSLFRYDK